ncbi:fructose-1,6-bisphosphatase [Candidatus Peregrinibacteria bacterium]|nr:fructose-1,6-bisphosphatase [Candidatus Peregrinibacteria bacterium]
MQNLQSYLEGAGAGDELIGVFGSLTESVRKISLAVRTADTGKIGTTNSYGEEQVAMDVFSNTILIEELKKNSQVGLVASEELPDEEKIGGGEYALAFDPLDGSSLVDVNFSVGTIIGIYKKKTFIGVKGDDQVAALIAVYGPRTTIFLTVKKGVAQFMLNLKGEFILMKDKIQVGEGSDASSGASKYFAPGNLRACASNLAYLDLVNYWIKEQYTLRYSGGMVPDINHILLKGKGVFAYPGYKDEPNGKLRLLFECAPMSLIMEQAGGAASDGKIRILEKKLENLEQRTPIFIGSKGEVQRCSNALK